MGKRAVQGLRPLKILRRILKACADSQICAPASREVTAQHSRCRACAEWRVKSIYSLCVSCRNSCGYEVPQRIFPRQRAGYLRESASLKSPTGFSRAAALERVFPPFLSVQKWGPRRDTSPVIRRVESSCPAGKRAIHLPPPCGHRASPYYLILNIRKSQFFNCKTQKLVLYCQFR